MAYELYNTTLFLDSNLQAYYRLESGTITTDFRNSNTLTNNNTVSSSTGKFGYGADFSSSNTNKSLSRGTNLGVSSSSWTYMFWIKMNTEISSSTQDICYHALATQQILNIIYYDYNGGTRRLRFASYPYGGAFSSVDYTVTLGTSTYYLLAMTSDGATVTAYFNGSSVGTIAYPSAGSGAPDLFVFGGANTFCSCIIDDMAVFNRVLTGTEISNYYNGLLPLIQGGSFLFNLT